MGNTGSSQKVSSQDRAILDLKIQRDKIYQYQKRITALTDRETEIARECLARNDKRRALLALRRKKYQETLLSKTDSQLAQLEQLTGQVEFALVQKDVLFGLQQGTKVLQAINKEIGGIEAVDRLMEETAEARAYQEFQEVSQMLEGSLSTQDEEDVEDELEALEREVAGPVQLPAVPSDPLPERPQPPVEVQEESQEPTRTPVLAS
ncbi:Charged multivesicular body protein 6 [Penicillium diatomitis]|uniref:Charged multivesicular body protein 6 n=1 Tax=Penicillium diatomitis TaxID=2819901 RepID=A0A9W9XEZ5_9EURO|nr:Charged multivesicular body protein 6 [Penicillium diatomitis]KAJ5489638.1 Charged multivesicular body protein 6 [Penicillium diatomitis]